MKRNHTRQSRIAAILLCMTMLMMLLAGCGNADKQAQNSSDIQGEAADDGVFITLYMSSEVEATEEQSNASGEVETVDDMTTTMVTIIPEDSVNAETIAEAYNERVIVSLYGESAVINGVKTEENQVWVDFDSASLKALPLEEGTEGVLFYHLARSITDNLSDVDHVYLTMDGGQDFRLAHLWFEANRPFYSGVMPMEGE